MPIRQAVEVLRDDIRVTWAIADIPISCARNSRQDIDDLQKQITAMERRDQTLAPVVDGLRRPGTKKPGDC
jgi:hypothetical protein